MQIQHDDQTFRDQPSLLEWASTADSMQQGAESRNETFREIQDRLPEKRRVWFARIVAAGRHGVTLDELAAQTGQSANQFSGRVTELVKDHLVVRTGERRPTRSGSTAAVLVAAKFYSRSQGEDSSMSIKQVPACEMPDAITNTKTPTDQHGRTIADGRLYRVTVGRRTVIGTVREDEMGEYWFRLRHSENWQSVNQMDAAAAWEWIDE